MSLNQLEGQVIVKSCLLSTWEKLIVISGFVSFLFCYLSGDFYFYCLQRDFYCPVIC